MGGVFETMLISDGRVRLFDRHLGRLAASGVAEPVIEQVRELVARQVTAADDPVVVRIDVTAAGVTARSREPRPPTPLSGVLVEGYDPGDDTRTRKRIDRVWAEAAETTAGGEALLVSPHGLVGETTRANVFAILGDVVVTPGAGGILPGVTRSWAIEQLGAIERALTLEELRHADGAFLTTAGRGIVALADVGGVGIPVHPLVEQLAEAWRVL
ncbi:MAG: branched-chain amino acid aminotransferase [Gaiellaceae bacterium]|nr:branched-chain amino acid aminotransferase [Gaiellaceae bacterium]